MRWFLSIQYNVSVILILAWIVHFILWCLLSFLSVNLMTHV